MSDTLLLIEDEPLLSAELVRHFKRAGFEVMTAGTLAEAKRLLLHDEVQPLVVISDMSLPDGNALDLIEFLRPQFTQLVILVLSHCNAVAEAEKALRAGAKWRLRRARAPRPSCACARYRRSAISPSGCAAHSA